MCTHIIKMIWLNHCKVFWWFFCVGGRDIIYLRHNTWFCSGNCINYFQLLFVLIMMEFWLIVCLELRFWLFFLLLLLLHHLLEVLWMIYQQIPFHRLLVIAWMLNQLILLHYILLLYQLILLFNTNHHNYVYQALSS